MHPSVIAIASDSRFCFCARKMAKTGGGFSAMSPAKSYVYIQASAACTPDSKCYTYR